MKDRTTIWLSVLLLGAIASVSLLALAGILAVHSAADSARSSAHRAQVASDSARVAAEQAGTAVAALQVAAARTECVRAASAALDEARWQGVTQLLNATTRDQARTIGSRMLKLPSLLELEAHGGAVDHSQVQPCPTAKGKK